MARPRQTAGRDLASLAEGGTEDREGRCRAGCSGRLGFKIYIKLPRPRSVLPACLSSARGRSVWSGEGWGSASSSLRVCGFFSS